MKKSIPYLLIIMIFVSFCGCQQYKNADIDNIEQYKNTNIDNIDEFVFIYNGYIENIYDKALSYRDFCSYTIGTTTMEISEKQTENSSNQTSRYTLKKSGEFEYTVDEQFITCTFSKEKTNEYINNIIEIINSKDDPLAKHEYIPEMSIANDDGIMITNPNAYKPFNISIKPSNNTYEISKEKYEQLLILFEKIRNIVEYNACNNIDTTDNNNSPTIHTTTPQVASFFFTGNIAKNGTALTTDQLANGVSLFSTVSPCVHENDNTKINDNDIAVVPGSHGSICITMEAGDGTDPTKSHAETDAIISLDLQMKSGTNTASNIPLIIGIDTNDDGKNDAFYSDVLEPGVYKFNDPTGLGTEENLKNNKLKITGNLTNLADATEAYYFANGNAFYEIDTTTGKGDLTKPVNKGTAYEGKLNYNITWYWADQISNIEQQNITSNNVSSIDSTTDTQVKLTFAANAVQID